MDKDATESGTEEQTLPVQNKAFNVYTNEDRANFASLYLLHGSVKEVAKITNWPERTMYAWLKSDWWPKYYDEARRLHAEVIEANLADMVLLAAEALKDRIVNGDEVLTKSGVRRIKVKAKELDGMLDRMVKNLRMLQNKPTKVSVEAKFDVAKIEKNFAEMAEKFKDSVVAEY